MSIESTRNTMLAYWEKHDSKYLAEDAVFTDTSSGQETKGREAISQMLHYFYHIAFDATMDVKNTIFADGQAVVEGDFVGKHIGEFAGIPASGKSVRVPMCVTYDLEGDQVKRGRIYLQASVLMQQLGAK